MKKHFFLLVVGVIVLWGTFVPPSFASYLSLIKKESSICDMFLPLGFSTELPVSETLTDDEKKILETFAPENGRYISVFKKDGKILCIDFSYYPEIRDLSIPKNPINLSKIKKFKDLEGFSISWSTINSINPKVLKDLKKLKNLKILDIKGDFKIIPKAVLNISSLEVLSMEGNQIKEISKNIVQLKNLRYLSLEGNKLKYIPDEISELSNLEYLDLSFNEISDIPISLQKLKKLELLDFASNNLSLSSFPLFSFPHLKNLSLSFNNIKNFSFEGGNDFLSEFGLNGNQLTQFPKGVTNLSSLTKLYLDNNKLSSIPSEIGNLTHLFHLYLNNNKLSFLPSEIENLTELRNLMLENNQLTTIPVVLKNLRLEHFHLHGNDFSDEERDKLIEQFPSVSFTY